jgi:hypothetical protein
VNKGDHNVSNVALVLTTWNNSSPNIVKALYFVDVFHVNILAYKHNPATGAVENRRIFALAPGVGQAEIY